jgi:mono/diheme cytochrome c family protein
VQQHGGGDEVTNDVKDEVAEGVADDGEEKSFFVRGALLGLVAGAAVAVLLISAGGSVISLADDLFGSSTEEVAADEPAGGGDSLVAAGEALTSTCIGCHSLDGSVLVGPSWQGLAGSERQLDDGSSVIADSAYIRNSIINPNDQIVSGFAAGQMPLNYGDTFSEEELDALVAYIESL